MPVLLTQGLKYFAYMCTKNHSLNYMPICLENFFLLSNFLPTNFCQIHVHVTVSYDDLAESISNTVISDINC